MCSCIQEAPLAYDAIWSMALALNVAMEKLAPMNKSIHNFTYSNKDIADQIYDAMNATQFLGVSVGHSSGSRWGIPLGLGGAFLLVSVGYSSWSRWGNTFFKRFSEDFRNSLPYEVALCMCFSFTDCSPSILLGLIRTNRYEYQSVQCKS